MFQAKSKADEFRTSLDISTKDSYEKELRNHSVNSI